MITKQNQYIQEDRCTLTGEVCKQSGACHECEMAYEQEQINAIVKNLEEKQ